MNLNKTGKSLEAFLTREATREVLRLFLPMAIMVLVIGGSLVTYVTVSEFRKQVEIDKEKEEYLLNIMQFSLLKDLETLVSDIHIITGSGFLTNYIHSRSNDSLRKLTSHYASFITDRNVYSQLRYIDENGQEIIRVNKKHDRVRVVPDYQLQNKKDRYYFQRTIQLSKGEYYLSPMDLNMEFGKVEIPFTPMLRIATPVVDSGGAPAGIVVLNYRAGLMIDILTELKPVNTTTAYSLINQDGYWLKAEDPALEWGFMLNKETLFSQSYPAAWEAMQKRGKGRISTGSGTFFYRLIDPIKEMRGGHNSSVSSDNGVDHKYSWFLVAHVPPEKFSYVYFVMMMPKTLGASAIILFILLAGCWQMAVARCEQRKNQRYMHLLSKGLEQSPAAVVITDFQGEIAYVNPKFESMSGYLAEEVLGQNPRIFKSGKTEDDVYASLWKTISAGTPWRGNFENKTKKETPYYVDAQISPILGANNSIEFFIAVQEDVTDKVNLHKQLKELATIDALTGAYRRGYFLNRCEQEIHRLSRYNHTLSTLLFDLDNFKSINDNFGHYGGDLVLMAFVENVKSVLRDSDLIGRLGGEEFAVLLAETNKEGAIHIANRLREMVEQLVVNFENQQITFTVSVGCATWIDGDTDIDSILKRADKALYLAKKNGRNTVGVL